MKDVSEHIQRRSVVFGDRPLFAFLRDSDVDARRRLAFAPYLAHFVMTFADLYNFVLPENPPTDRYQELVNIHVAEDATHWQWYLADLTNADLDPTLRFTDALRFLWSTSTVKTRMLSYGICRLGGGMSTLQKLVMVNCIEAAGRVSLGAVAVAGRALEPGIGRKLVYFGNHHIDTESDHTLEDPAVRRSLDAVALTAPERARLLATVDQVFDLFTDFVDEVFELARSGRAATDFAAKALR